MNVNILHKCFHLFPVFTAKQLFKFCCFIRYMTLFRVLASAQPHTTCYYSISRNFSVVFGNHLLSVFPVGFLTFIKEIPV